MNILEAVHDRNLLGASSAFADLTSWRSWLAFLGGIYGLPLDSESAAVFEKCTGRAYAPPAGGWSEAALIVGRQAGKTKAAGLLVSYAAAFAPRCTDGELYALLLAQDHRAAIRAAFSYVASLFEASPILRRLVVRRTADTLALENGVTVAAYPCRPQSVRGLRSLIAVADELAFFRSTEWLPQDAEMLRALRPGLATTGGRLVVLSSPYAQTGALWELRCRHYGREDAPVLVWQADAPTMNPLLPADYLARMREDDPEAYRSEVLGEFRTGLSALLDPEAIAACVAQGRRELPPANGVEYVAFVDPSGGRRDPFTLAVAHRCEGRAVVDAVRAWRPPFNPSGVVAEAAELLRGYRVRKVVGDRYAGEWPREQFRSQGIEYDVATRDRSALYLELLASINAGRVEIPDEPALLRELRSLERRRGVSGRDRVDHPPGAHDDRANVVAGVAHLLGAERPPLVLL